MDVRCPDYATGLQPRAGRIHRLVQGGTAAGGIHGKATVTAWRVSLEARRLGPISIKVRITAVRKLAVEAADNGLLAPELPSGIARIKGVRFYGCSCGNLLSLRQA